ncbi:hypothetical protein L208DRAFT_1298399, partial [Tricholoma matsutake]
FCLCTIEKDELGEHDIYKINLLEGMLMAREAWKHVDDATIWHCWNHTKIQGEIIDHNICDPLTPRADQDAWGILQTFASSEMTLPKAEECLKKQLGN